jgi:hypothetical protein
MNKFNLLKTDRDICKKYKPNANVIFYFKSPLKTNRVIKFDDNTWMHIETSMSNGEGFLMTQKNAIKLDSFYNVLEKHIDKQGRLIYLYEIVDIKDSPINKHI